MLARLNSRLLFNNFIKSFTVMASKNLVDSAEKKGEFSKKLNDAKHLVIITGAGVSAESGIPTFRGEGGYWRTHNAQELATPEAFKKDPSLVWQFYQYRRDVVFSKKPNKGHEAIAAIEKKFLKEGKQFTLITQNVDRYHLQAGSQNVIEMHGNIIETRCVKCGHIEENKTKLVDANMTEKLPANQLPKCKKGSCGGLIRPNVVWFNEPIDPNVYNKIEKALDSCDLYLIVGTSSVVMPAAFFAYRVKGNGVTVGEFNIEETATCDVADFYFRGKSSETLPKYLC